MIYALFEFLGAILCAYVSINDYKNYNYRSALKWAFGSGVAFAFFMAIIIQEML